MKLSRSHTFDAPIDQVWAMFADPASHVAKFTSMGHRDIEIVSHSGSADEGRFEIEVRQVVEVELPGFARKVLKPVNTVVSTDRWERHEDGSCSGIQQVDTIGAPVKVSGTTALTADGERTGYEISVDISVKVPLIGGKISDWAKGDVENQLQAEFDAGDAWLAEHR